MSQQSKGYAFELSLGFWQLRSVRGESECEWCVCVSVNGECEVCVCVSVRCVYV